MAHEPYEARERAAIVASALLVGCVILLGCQLDIALRRLPPEQPIAVHVSASGEEPNPYPVVDYDVLMEGRRVYDERCSPCHGVSGHGDGPLAEVLPITPRNYHDDPFKWGSRPSDIVETISSGRSDVMPGFADSLSQREIWATAYVVWYWVPEDKRAHDTAEDLARSNHRRPRR